MKKFVVIAVLLCVGCEKSQSEEIAQCKKTITNWLKAPSSFKEISASSSIVDDKLQREFDKNVDEKYRMKHPKTPYGMVFIEYDAVNSFNAPIRYTDNCFFGVTKGRIDPLKPLGSSITDRMFQEN